MSVLERNDNGVANDYEHIPKLVRSGQSIVLGDTLFKWYEIAPEDAPVPAAVADLARLGLADAARLGELRLRGSVGFVILHRCGEGFYFLLVSTWENDNELWETVWAKDGAATPGSTRGRSRARIARRSACGSSARSRTSARRGAGTCAPAGAARSASPTCATRTRASCETSRLGAREAAPGEGGR